MSDDSRKPTRRGFLKAATVAMGGAMGAVLSVPLVRYVLFPVGRKTVSSATEPVDVGAVTELVRGGPPVRVQVIARKLRDAWGAVENVAIGSAWVSQTEKGEVRAFSAACPHLGCAIDYDEGASEYRCPCHRSAFGDDGDKKAGPSKRGLDPLPVQVEGGRVKLTYLRFKPDIAEREPV